jgi:chromosomal replication initiator protein
VSDPAEAPIWHRFRAELRQAVNESTWHIWLEPLELHSIAGSTLLLTAPDSVRTWVQGRFAPLLQACAETALGPGARVEFGGPQEPPPASATPPQPVTARQDLDPRMTFEQFVIGDSNRMAHAAALAVAEMPSLTYNPLFVCGPPGLGKTHLLHSIANYVTEHGDGLTARYTTGEAFTDHFVGAVHTGGMDAFRSAYRGVDVLLVDDVQFLQRKARTEEEFFHTFNELKLAGAQIVLTSDRPPRDLDALEDRLRERFASGLVCDVQPADRATRLTILRKRVLQDAIRGVEPEALDLIADRVVTNIRVLEGALIRVVAFASLTSRAITAGLADEVLSGLYPELRPPHRRTIEDIQRKTCEAFDVTFDELLSASKVQRVALARQFAMYLARELTDETLPSIGRAFGNRNHTTVLHACRRTAQRIASDPEAYDAVRRLTEALGDR